MVVGSRCQNIALTRSVGTRDSPMVTVVLLFENHDEWSYALLVLLILQQQLLVTIAKYT